MNASLTFPPADYGPTADTRCEECGGTVRCLSYDHGSKATTNAPCGHPASIRVVWTEGGAA